MGRTTWNGPASYGGGKHGVGTHAVVARLAQPRSPDPVQLRLGLTGEVRAHRRSVTVSEDIGRMTGADNDDLDRSALTPVTTIACGA